MMTLATEVATQRYRNGTTISALDLKERKQLCDDLEYCVLHDKELLTIVIDEFVYRLNDNELKDFKAEVNKILGED